MSLSAISALERSREFIAAAAEAMTKKSMTSSIESLTLFDASEICGKTTSYATEVVSDLDTIMFR